MSNKSNGTAFEKEFAELLSKHGFWVHRLQDNQNGQPFDVIAARNGRTYVFDCKDCKYEDFSLYRIEENQMCAMQLWGECGNTDGLFALHMPSGLKILSYLRVRKLMEEGRKRIRYRSISEVTMTFEEWVNENNHQQ